MMHKTIIFLLSLTFGVSLQAQIQKPIGTNLSGVVDWSSEFVFTDAFKQSRIWTPYDGNGAGAWNSGVAIPLRSDGYPLEIPYNDGVHPPQHVRALMVWDLEAATPVGKYRLIAQGDGQITLNFGASGTYTCPLDTLVDVHGAVALSIIRSNVNNPVHAVQFIFPNYVDSYTTKVFTDEFLDFVADFQVLRFMDWTRTNNSTVATWADRGKYNYYTQAQEEGVAWEYIIQLCNLQRKDAWINIPHLADDDYIRQLANLLKNELHPDLNIYIEYSNELWNGIFSQNEAAADAATALGYTGQPWEKSWKYTSKRSADVFHIFENVYGVNHPRLVKVIPSHAANAWLSNQIIAYFKDAFYNPHQVTANALAIAPYFGGVADQIGDAGLIQTATVEQIVDSMALTLQETFGWMAENKIVADNQQLDLICYEGGQHLVASWAYINDTTLTRKLNAANHHPDLKAVYCDYFDYWYENMGGLFAHFSSHGLYGKYGSWGVKETMYDVDNPKYKALQSCVFADNVVAVGEVKNIKQSFQVFPNPTKDKLTIQIDYPLEKGSTVEVYNILGVLMLKQSIHDMQPQIDMSGWMRGSYFMVVKSGGLSYRPIRVLRI